MTKLPDEPVVDVRLMTTLASDEDGKKMLDYIDALRGALEKAEAELAACRADAERYRWLRESQSIPANILLNHHESLDAAIDKARGKP